MCSTAALYLNTFVGVAEAFLKVPALHAPEPPFLVAQVVVLALFVVLTASCAKRFRDASFPDV